MPLRPGFVWLTINLALIIQCLSRFLFLNFTYPLRCVCVLPVVRVPQVDTTALCHEMWKQIQVQADCCHNLSWVSTWCGLIALRIPQLSQVSKVNQVGLCLVTHITMRMPVTARLRQIWIGGSTAQSRGGRACRHFYRRRLGSLPVNLYKELCEQKRK
jgi:hypothetical protein